MLSLADQRICPIIKMFSITLLLNLYGVNIIIKTEPQSHICSLKAFQPLQSPRLPCGKRAHLQILKSRKRGSLGHIYLYTSETLSKQPKQNTTKINAEYPTIIYSLLTMDYHCQQRIGQGRAGGQGRSWGGGGALLVSSPHSSGGNTRQSI